VALPARYRNILLSTADPGEGYRRCFEEAESALEEIDYSFTELVVYATEVRYAIQVLTGHRRRVENFADPTGASDAELFRLLDTVPTKRVVFIGAGPFPLTALRLAERYPQALVSCIDDNPVAHFVAEAVIEKLGYQVECRLVDAREVDYAVFDAVIVAAMVRGKRELVEAILSQSSARVIVRGTTGLTHERLSEIPAPFADDGRFKAP
jgi:hypothetical protein